MTETPDDMLLPGWLSQGLSRLLVLAGVLAVVYTMPVLQIISIFVVLSVIVVLLEITARPKRKASRLTDAPSVYHVAVGAVAGVFVGVVLAVIAAVLFASNTRSEGVDLPACLRWGAAVGATLGVILPRPAMFVLDLLTAFW